MNTPPSRSGTQDQTTGPADADRSGARGLAGRPEAVADRLYPRWITARRGFALSLAQAMGWSMMLPVLVGIASALAAPATAALLARVVRHGDLAGQSSASAPQATSLVGGLIVAVVAARAASWTSTVLLRRRCELAGSAISRCLARSVMLTPRLDPVFSTNQVVCRYPEILAQYVFLAEVPGHLLGIAALLAVAVMTGGWAAAAAALAGITVVLAIGYTLNSWEARAAFAVERCEATRTRLLSTILTRRAALARQSLARHAVTAFDIARRPQIHALRRRTIIHAAAAALWRNVELLALLAALVAIGAAGRLATLGPALGLLVIVRLLGEQITAAISVVSCLQDARPVLHTLRANWFDTTLPTTPEPVPHTPLRDGAPAGAGVEVPWGARVLVLGADATPTSPLLHRLATEHGLGTTMLIDRARPLLPDTVRTAITLGSAVDEQRYAAALTASGLDGALRAWGPIADRRRVGRDDGLSDGERIRVQLAQALVWGPELLLLDDVFAALDPATTAAVAPAVLGPAGPSRTVVFTTTRPELTIWADHLVIVSGDTVRSLPASQVTRHDLRAVTDQHTCVTLLALLRATPSPADTDTEDAGARCPAPARAAPAAADEGLREDTDTAGGRDDAGTTSASVTGMARHALGLYGPSVTAAVGVAGLVAVAASISAAQLADTAGPAALLGPLCVLTAAALGATYLVYALAGTAAISRMTRLQHSVLATLLTPHSHDPPLARLTTDVHLTEFRASERLQANALSLISTLVFFAAAVATAPVLLAWLVPALVAIAVIVRAARPYRDQAQTLAIHAREPLLGYVETAAHIAPTFRHPAAHTALRRGFAELSDTAFWAGRRSLDIRAALLAAVETVAIVLFACTALLTLHLSSTRLGLTTATLVYLAYTTTTQLASTVEQLLQADSLHALLGRVASLTGHSRLTIDPSHPRTGAARAWPTTHLTAGPDDRLQLPTNPPLHLSPGRAVALTGPSGTGKSLLLRRAIGPGTDLAPRHGPPRTVALLEADIPPLGLTLHRFLDPDHAHDPAIIERAWHDLHPPGRARPPSLDHLLDQLPHDHRQLANLARAHLHRPDLLLLDEALSALDEPTEAHIITTLTSHFPATATVVVLHRRTNLHLLHQEVAVTNQPDT